MGYFLETDPINGQSFFWAITANVPKTPDAQGRFGTKHFGPGAKVYIFHGGWSDGGDRQVVMGKHRKSGRIIDIIMASLQLENFRATKVFNPAFIYAVAHASYYIDNNKEYDNHYIKNWANLLNKRRFWKYEGSTIKEVITHKAPFSDYYGNIEVVLSTPIPKDLCFLTGKIDKENGETRGGSFSYFGNKLIAVHRLKAEDIPVGSKFTLRF